MAHHDTDTSGASHGSVKSYIIGTTLCIILTIIPFALVMTGAFSKTVTIGGVITAALVQLIVQLHYFLHLDTSSEQRWNVIALLYAILIMALIIGGSMWIMHHLHGRLM